MHLIVYLVALIGLLAIVVVAICRVKDPDRIKISFGRQFYLDVSRGNTDNASPLPEPRRGSHATSRAVRS